MIPSKNKDSTNKNKRKRSAETQTRLTRKDKMIKLKNDMNSTTNTENTKEFSSNDMPKSSQEEISCQADYYVMDSLDSFSVNETNINNILTNVSSSSTQTSPRGHVDVEYLTPSNLEEITFTLFNKDSNSNLCNDNTKTVHDITNSTDDLDHYETSQLFIDEDDVDLMVMQNDNLQSTACGSSRQVIGSTQTRRPSLGQIRSSSIETQTDHDVLLSTNAETHDDADDIILMNNETQTDAFFNTMAHSSDTPWCTIETQTCEDFSDIEQYLCSTIHTQTHDKARSELFPELTFADTQTQTGLDDSNSPSLVTTHTQTPSLF